VTKYGAKKTPCRHGHTHASGRGGIKVPRAVKRGEACPLLPWPPIKEYLELFYRDGKTTSEIAALYGCSPVTIRQVRKSFGIDPVRSTLRERLDRFSVAMPNGCIEWVGARMASGYGVISCALPNHHRTAKAHRVSWELANNASLLPGAVIMHECDNPPCVNPRHLTLGSHLENSAQAQARGRLKIRRGAENERALLNEAMVIEARQRFQSGESIPKIARSMNVKYHAMYNAVQGRSWAWLK